MAHLCARLYSDQCIACVRGIPANPTASGRIVGYRFQGLSTAYRFYRPILPHFKLSVHKDRTPVNLPQLGLLLKHLKKLLKINGETVAGMQEMTHRAHVFLKKIGGALLRTPPPPQQAGHTFGTPWSTHPTDPVKTFFKSKGCQVWRGSV